MLKIRQFLLLLILMSIFGGYSLANPSRQPNLTKKNPAIQTDLKSALPPLPPDFEAIEVPELSFVLRIKIFTVTSSQTFTSDVSPTTNSVPIALATVEAKILPLMEEIAGLLAQAALKKRPGSTISQVTAKPLKFTCEKNVVSVFYELHVYVIVKRNNPKAKPPDYIPPVKLPPNFAHFPAHPSWIFLYSRH